MAISGEGAFTLSIDEMDPEERVWYIERMDKHLKAVKKKIAEKTPRARGRSRVK